MCNLLNEKKLIRKIESIRREMIQSGMEEGLSSKKTIELSQSLDHHLLRYQKLSYDAQKTLIV